MQLGFGIGISDLYERAGLLKVDAAFLRFLAEADAELHERLLAARTNPGARAAKAVGLNRFLPGPLREALNLLPRRMVPDTSFEISRTVQ